MQIGGLMTNLSTKLKLSKKYTNHCIRVIGINLMYEGGLQAEQISCVTGHKNPFSLMKYLRTNEESCKRASNILADGRNSESYTFSATACRSVMSTDEEITVTSKRMKETTVESTQSTSATTSTSWKPTAVLEKDGLKLSFYF